MFLEHRKLENQVILVKVKLIKGIKFKFIKDLYNTF